MFAAPTEMGYVIGPDLLKGHMVVTWKCPGGFETAIWRADATRATVDEVITENWEDALIAHATMWETARRLEKYSRLWAYIDSPRKPRKDAS